MTDDLRADVSEDPSVPEIRIVGGSPEDWEVAAVTAVLTAALDAIAQESRRRDAGKTGWQASQRALRQPIQRGRWASWNG